MVTVKNSAPTETKGRQKTMNRTSVAKKNFSILDELRTTFVNGFYLRSSEGYSGEYVAWCKREPFTGSDPIDESGDVWFEFGPTRADAIANLWQSLDSSKEQK